MTGLEMRREMGSGWCPNNSNHRLVNFGRATAQCVACRIQWTVVLTARDAAGHPVFVVEADPL